MDIDLRRLDGCVTEPKRDDRLIDTALQQLHCRAMSEHVGTDAFASERWTGASGILTVLADEMLERVAA